MNDAMAALVEDFYSNVLHCDQWRFSAAEHRIRCSAHILHLCCIDAFNHFEPHIKKLRNLAIFLKNSPTKMVLFSASCSNFPDCPETKPMLDVCTRWNSTFDMLSRSLELRLAIDHFTDHKEFTQFKLVEDEWITIKEVQVFLEIFNWVSHCLTEQNCGTLSATVPYYQKIIHYCCAHIYGPKRSSCESITAAAVAAVTKLEKYFDKVFFVVISRSVLQITLLLC